MYIKLNTFFYNFVYKTHIMPKRRKQKKNNDTLLNLNKLPIPDEIVKLMISFLPKKWIVPRIPKKMNSQLYSLRSLYVNNDKCLFDVNTHVKIKKSIYKKFQNEYKYLVPPNVQSIGKILGYVSPESHIDNKYKIWQIKDAKPYKGDILYKVLFLQKHNKINCEMNHVIDTKDMPYKRNAYYKLEEMASKYGIYYFYPNEVKFYIDIEDREVCITKTNKVMFDKSGI